MRAVVVAGGSAPGVAWLRRVVAGAGLIVAADGGAATLRAAGLVPHLVVGDLDSLDGAAQAALAAAGVAFEAHPAEKDETDLELALQAAAGRGATAIDVLGALGGPRLDHALANVLLLTLPWLSDLRVTLLDPHHEARLLRGPGSLDLAGRPGDTVSLLPLTPVASGIGTTGLHYALDGGTLPMGSPRGVSNAMTAAGATVRLESGMLLVVRYHVTPD